MKRIPESTRNEGSLRQRYEIYVAQAESLGWDVKTFEEWCES